MKDRDAILATASLVIATAEAPWNIRKEAMLAFEQTLLASSDPDDAGSLTELASLLPTLRLLYERFETELEIAFVHAALSGKEPLDNYTLFRRFETLVCNEVTLARLGPNDEVAMIGSGPLPLSAILLSTRFGLRVTAIERDSYAAALSRRIIEHLGLETKIRINTEEGHKAVIQNASCVLVAVLAKPKQAILENILRTCDTCTTVVCRTSHGVRQALYSPTDPLWFREYRTIGLNAARGDQTISSLILGKPSQL
jgi:hypothetical protein